MRDSEISPSLCPYISPFRNVNESNKPREAVRYVSPQVRGVRNYPRDVAARHINVELMCQLTNVMCQLLYDTLDSSYDNLEAGPFAFITKTATKNLILAQFQPL